MTTKTFGEDAEQDNGWYTFGPFNPAEGELQPEVGGYVFKLIVEGLDGDDGNLYKFFFLNQAIKIYRLRVEMHFATSIVLDYLTMLDLSVTFTPFCLKVF